MDISGFENSFMEKFGNRNEKPVLFFSPGRVNLIGEHTDYNGGYVFPCAIGYGTYLAVRLTDTKKIRLSSLNFSGDVSIGSDVSPVKMEKSWANYPLGVMNEFIKRGFQLRGMDMIFSGDVPNGAGLSSSASIEMVTAVALNTLLDAKLSTLDLVKMSQKAENEFVGMNCGIMDQFAVGFGKKDHAIFLNCDSLKYENVPVMLAEYNLVIANTNKRRGLTDSKYNERRAECERAVELLSTNRKIINLSELGASDLDLLEKHIPDPIVRKRAKHVITENDRVLEAVKVLKENNIIRFGELMNASHDSLKDDYEVTGNELDALAYGARKIKGVLGSRMTGAGFGGCTVSIVKKSETENFIKELTVYYSGVTGLVPDFYIPSISGGASVL
jgi:galactokinase